MFRLYKSKLNVDLPKFRVASRTVEGLDDVAAIDRMIRGNSKYMKNTFNYTCENEQGVLIPVDFDININ